MGFYIVMTFWFIIATTILIRSPKEWRAELATLFIVITIIYLIPKSEFSTGDLGWDIVISTVLGMAFSFLNSKVHEKIRSRKGGSDV